MTRSIYNLSLDELRHEVTALGQPAYRAGQVAAWLYHRLVRSWDEMTDLPRALRAQLAERFTLAAPEPVRALWSADGSTHKTLLRLADGQTVETVLMEYAETERGRERATVCVSTQAGCAMGCIFCATGQQGFVRNLSSGEIVAQVLHVERLARERGGHLTNLVFMGMGEPLANYDQVLRAIRLLADQAGFGLGQRHMTLSTVGLVPMIRRFAGEGLQVGLAISLHTPDDAARRRLVPTAKHSVAEILAAAADWSRVTGRRFTVEYALIQRDNDTPEAARALVALLKGVPCHVNLIPVNPTANTATRRSSRGRVLAFQRILTEAGINATVRAEKGIDIAAGCGQLRGEEEGRRARRSATEDRDAADATLALLEDGATALSVVQVG